MQKFFAFNDHGTITSVHPLVGDGEMNPYTGAVGIRRVPVTVIPTADWRRLVDLTRVFLNAEIGWLDPEGCELSELLAKVEVGNA